MIDVKTDANGVIHLTVTGQIDAAQMRTGLDAFFAACPDTGKCNTLYRVTDVSMPTAGALAVEMGYLPKLFGLIGRLDKVAIVANQQWVRSAAKIESAMIPGLVIAVFDETQEAAARAHTGAAA